ncbi:MAG: flagellar motor protein MotB [Desulfovibrio sp.]|jgi:chemotaxis protein MotB|nr:flagellar motor protein MotB [Desulfovibrio sp.]
MARTPSSISRLRPLRGSPARRGEEAEGSPIWLITFSDLVTLLITFFVLLLSMSSMDATTLARISSFAGGPARISASSGTGRVPERIEIVTALIKDPRNILNKTRRIKDLLFPRDVLPPQLSRGELEENLDVLAHPEGVVIVLTEGLLFAPQSAALDARGEALIDLLTPVILAVNANANISGFTDSSPARGMSNEDLSALRALAVLERFLHGGIEANRLSISGYGGDRPIESNDTPEGRRKNRRVEVLLKTAPRMGSYSN